MVCPRAVNLTIPIPETMLAHGEEPGCWYPANIHSSRNGVSGSNNILILSLAGSVSLYDGTKCTEEHSSLHVPSDIFGLALTYTPFDSFLVLF